MLTILLVLASQAAPFPAEEAPKRMTLPAGFSATLFAGEPDLVQPMGFTFDDRGRLWVVENFSYPHWLPAGKEGRDRVSIYEDANGDTAMTISRPMTFAFPGEAGFLARMPLFGCSEMMTEAPSLTPPSALVTRVSGVAP